MLGRDLSRVLIIDNNPENFQMQPQNGICIRSWIGDENDTALSLIFPILKSKPYLAGIPALDIEDVREVLRGIKEKVLGDNSNSYPA